MSPMVIVLVLLAALIAGALGVVATYYWLQGRATSRMQQAQRDADALLEEARNQQRELVLQSKDEALRLRSEIDQEVKERRAGSNRHPRRSQQKEGGAAKKEEEPGRRGPAPRTR